MAGARFTLPNRRYAAILAEYRSRSRASARELLATTAPTALRAQWARGLDANVDSYNAALSVCGAHWERALGLLEAMRETAALEPTVVSYKWAIAACVKAKEWPRVAALLSEMRTRGLERRDARYSAAIAACGAQRALAPRRDARARPAPDARTAPRSRRALARPGRARRAAR